MNHIVMGEGEHDAHFICMYINGMSSSPEIDWFLAEELDGEISIRPKEESAIRDFRHGRSSEYLLKSEEGISNLLRVFCYYAEDYLLNKFSCTLVVDLDKRSMKSIKEDIQDQLDEYYRGNLELVSCSLISSAGELKTWRGKLRAVNHDITRELGIITFDDDLEAAANLNPSSGWYQKSKTLNDYASEPNVRNAMSDAFPSP